MRSRISLLTLWLQIILVSFSSEGNCGDFRYDSLKKSNEYMRINNGFSMSMREYMISGFHQKESAENKDTAVVQNFTKYQRKSPWITFGLAWGPGFFVRGLGHYYIGEKKTAYLLLSAEMVSISLFYLEYRIGQEFEKEGLERVDMSFVGFLGVAVFGFSYMYDYIGAPYKANKKNIEHLLSHRILPKVGDGKLVLNICFAF